MPSPKSRTYHLSRVNRIIRLTIWISSEVDSVNAQRKWVVEQLSSLIRNQTMPRDDTWILTALQFLILHGLFQVKKKNKDSEVPLVRSHTPPHKAVAHGLFQSYTGPQVRYSLTTCMRYVESNLIRAWPSSRPDVRVAVRLPVL